MKNKEERKSREAAMPLVRVLFRNREESMAEVCAVKITAQVGDYPFHCGKIF